MTDKTMRIALTLLLILPADIAFGDVPLYAPNVGDEHKITMTYETSSETSNGSSGSSRGTNTIIERVTSVRADGLEIEYDFPKETSDEARARFWQAFFCNINSRELSHIREQWIPRDIAKFRGTFPNFVEENCFFFISGCINKMDRTVVV